MIDNPTGQRLPTGTVTFLFTDIEGSTQLWERHPEEMQSALARHDAILRNAIHSNHGHTIKTTGDGVHAVFEKAIDAIQAAIQAQSGLNSTFDVRSTKLGLRARMGLHTGEAELRDGDYYGQSLNRAARLMAVAHGGQILLSAVTGELAREHLMEGTSLNDLGEHHLKDLVRPEHIYQINTPGLPMEFPAIKTLHHIPNNLPLQLTSFIGRENEIDEIRKLIDANRIVTLTGSGGTGKTRISLEVGTQLLPSFVNGVWLVELAPLSDESQIIPALAQVFGLAGTAIQSVVKSCGGLSARQKAPAHSRQLRTPHRCLCAPCRSICSINARDSRSLPAVAKRWGLRARLPITHLRWRIPNRCISSWTAPAPPTQNSLSPNQTLHPSPRSAAVSTAFPWRSSLPPRGRNSCPLIRSPRGSMTCSACSWVAVAPLCRASRPCGR